MLFKMQWVLQGLCGVMIIAASLHAAEVNKRTHPDPSIQVKINNVLAKSYGYRDQSGKQPASASAPANADGCGNTQLATITNSRAGRIENTFVARGDVITVNRNIRCR